MSILNAPGPNRGRDEPSSAARVLLVGEALELMQPIPGLLSRAGLVVDVIAGDWRLRATPGIRRFTYAPDRGTLLGALQHRATAGYDLVVVGDDITLHRIRNADLDETVRLKLLPVCTAAQLAHLASKVGLVSMLASSGVPIPRFRIARSQHEVLECCDAIGYPAFVKVDLSSGGSGVHECASRSDAARVAAGSLALPLLVQEKIPGELLDLSGFFGHGELVHMGYSRCEAWAAGPFSPSSVRTYTQLSDVDPEVFGEVGELGRVLGIDGFANITAIRSSTDGKRYYIEADLRPNAWADSTRYIGDDAAPAIGEYFRHGTTFSMPRHRNPAFPAQQVICYPFRLQFSDVLRNRFGAWRVLRGFALAEVIYRCLPRHPIIPIERAVVRVVKRVLPPERYVRWLARYRAARTWLGERLVRGRDRPSGNAPSR